MAYQDFRKTYIVTKAINEGLSLDEIESLKITHREFKEKVNERNDNFEIITDDLIKKFSKAKVKEEDLVLDVVHFIEEADDDSLNTIITKLGLDPKKNSEEIAEFIQDHEANESFSEDKKFITETSIEFEDSLNEGADASATTFSHEIISGIATVDPKGVNNIVTGADIYEYIKKGLVYPVNAALKPLDMKDLPQFRYCDKSFKVPGNILDDAIKSGLAILDKLGKPKEVMWTGPTNDGSIYGAADIVLKSNKGLVGVSMKYGKGQLKNLSLNTMTQILFDNTNSIFKETEKLWDKMLLEFYVCMEEDIFRRFPNNKKARNIFVDVVKGIKKYNEHISSKTKMTENQFNVLSPLLDMDSSEYKKYGIVSDWCRKYLELFGGDMNKWNNIRTKYFDLIFTDYFNSREALIKKNLVKLFAVQLSVPDGEDLWYCAEGGKNLKVVPSLKRFNRLIKDMVFTHKLESTGSGYSFKIIATLNGVEFGTINILIRFSQGQMANYPATNSIGKFNKEHWSQLFGDQPNLK